jgi:transcriptional regulator with XRE-family HTH domain
VIQGQLVILATTVPGVSHPGTCGIVTHANGPAAITVHFKGPDGVVSHALTTAEQLRPYTGACPVCDTKPSEKHRFTTCAECGHRWVDPGWLYSGTNMAAEAAQHIPRIHGHEPNNVESWGWFGEPWGSRFNENYPRIPVPDGEACPYCARSIRPGDSGISLPCPLDDGFADTLSYHRLCFIREITAMGNVSPDPDVPVREPLKAVAPSNTAFISRYPTEHDLVEALRGPITGAQIRAAREAAGMSIYDLGSKLEVPFVLLEAIEREPEATLSPLGWRRLLEIFPALAESPERTTIPLSDVTDRWLADPEFRAGYEALAIPMALEFSRTQAGLTQDELATRMGTSQSTINRLERGRGSPPTVTTLQRWAAATGTQLSITLRPLR